MPDNHFDESEVTGEGIDRAFLREEWKKDREHVDACTRLLIDAFIKAGFRHNEDANQWIHPDVPGAWAQVDPVSGRLMLSDELASRFRELVGEMPPGAEDGILR